MYVEKSNDFTPTPAGVHKAVCTRFVDLGTHNNEMYNNTRREIVITWEIPEHRIEIDGKDVPVIHNQYFTWSMGQKANLRKALESWRNKPFTDAEMAGPPNGFSTKNLIGVGCMLQIMHDDKGKAKLQGIMPLGRDEWPVPENETLYFQMQNVDEFDRDAFDRLSDYYRGKIQQSPEWLACTGQSEPVNETHGRADMDDDIPF